jgi:ParB-like chromosome segregation protein Spo0J
MQLRREEPVALDLSLGRLRQLPEAAVRRMVESLRSKGQLSPLVAAECEGRLVLVDGFVRHLAAQRLGLETVLVEVVELSAVQMKAQVYLRNRERGLLLIEECRLVRELVEVDRLSQVEVGDLLERHKSWVCRRLALARQVSPHLLEDVALGLLGEGSLRKLARLPVRNQEELWAVAQREGLGSRDTGVLAELWQRAPDPEARDFLLAHPRAALERVRKKPAPPLDPRLGVAGQELLAGLVSIRRLCLRLLRRLRDGLGELPPEGVVEIVRARAQAEEDSRLLLKEVLAWTMKASGGER